MSFDAKELQALSAALEKAGETIAITETNKRIVQRGADIGHKAMKQKAPRSKDHSKSGRGYKGGGTMRPSGGHAAENIPLGNPRATGTAASAKVGWTLGDNSEYFYMKFVNWGTVKMPPRNFIDPAAAVVEPQLPGIAMQEYEKTIQQTLGRFT